MPTAPRHPPAARQLALVVWAGGALSAMCVSAAAQNTGSDPTAQARAVYAQVNQNLSRMAKQRFRARVPGVAYTSEVLASVEQGRVRKLAVTDPDDSGDVLTDLYFASDGTLVFVLRTTLGFKASGAVQTRNEDRLYFQQDRLVRMLAGLSRTELEPGDVLAQTEAASLLAMARALQHATLAPPAARVAVGQQRKLGHGVVLSLERGDVACHVELADDAGRVVHELADFILCDQAARLTGQRVALSYTPTRVMAAACQGNSACTQSEWVNLVTGAQPTQAQMAGRDTGQTLPAAADASWCKPHEVNLFTCQPGTKRVSVCASENVSSAHGQLLYRLGPAAGGPLELELPANSTSPSRSATGESVPFAGGGGSWLRFTQGSYSYVVYSGLGRWGRNGATEERHGVRVERDGKVVATLACTQPRVNELGPEWMQRLGVAPDARGFVFPDTGN